MKKITLRSTKESSEKEEIQVTEKIDEKLGKDIKINGKQINDIDIKSKENKKDIEVTDEKVTNNKKINKANDNKKDENPDERYERK